MNTKQFRKYLMYAIGEIILVVIGILIAVGINNFNETKKSDLEILKVADQIERKIETDLVTISTLRKTIAEDLKLYNLYLKKDKTESEKVKILFQAPFLVTINIQFLPVNPIISSVLDKVAVNNTEITNKLLQIEQDYKSMDRTLRPMEDIIKDELVANINYIKDNFTWYEKLVGTERNFTVDEYKYFGSNDYRNRVVHMKFLYVEGYDSILEEFEILLTKRLQDLKSEVD